MQINYSKIPKVLHNIEFHISEDADWDPYGLKVTAACERAIADEVMNYYILAADYYFQKGDKKQARGFLYFLELMGFSEEPAFVQVKNRMR